MPVRPQDPSYPASAPPAPPMGVSSGQGGILGASDPYRHGRTWPPPGRGGVRQDPQAAIRGLISDFPWQDLIKMQTDPLKQGYGNAMARIGLERQGLGLAEQSTERQFGVLGGQHDISQAGFDITGQRLGLQRQGLGLQGQELGLQGRRLGLEERALGIKEESAKYGTGRNIQNLIGAMAARGAVTTAGTARGVADLQRDLADQLALSSLERRGIALDRKSLGLQRQQIGLKRQDVGFRRGELRLARKEERLQYKEDRARIQDRLKELDLEGKKLGLAEGEAAQALQNGIKAAGLDVFFSAADLLSGLTSADVQQQQLIAGLLPRLLKMGAGGGGASLGVLGG